jgi:hypothetical protein
MDETIERKSVRIGSARCFDVHGCSGFWNRATGIAAGWF